MYFNEKEESREFNIKAAEVIGAFDRLGVKNPTPYRALYDCKNGTVLQYYKEKGIV